MEIEKGFFKSIKKYENYIVIGIFAIFFIALLIQSKFVWLYHDDYGYASLSYAYRQEGVKGHEFSIFQLIQYCIGHYKAWGGRVLCFFFECLFLGKSVRLYYIVQSGITLGIFIYSFLILNKMGKFNKILAALLTVLMYGLIDIVVVRESLFWASASCSYLWPMLPLLMFIYHFRNQEKNSLPMNIFCGILLFLASFSQEQIAIIAVSYIGLVTLMELIKTKKFDTLNMILSVVALIGFAILMLAPGNKVRMNHPSSEGFYDLSIVHKIKRNIPMICNTIFLPFNAKFLIILWIALIIVSVKVIKKKIGIQPFNYAALISNLYILTHMIFVSCEYYRNLITWFEKWNLRKVAIMIFLLQMALIVYNVTIWLISNKQEKVLYIFYGTVLSQVAMLFSNTYAARCMLMAQIALFIVMNYSFLEMLKNKDISLHICILLPIVIISVTHFFSITLGYYRNDATNQYNHEALEKASQRIKEGEKIESIELKKLPDLVYSACQPYEPGLEYMIPTMREYYDIPEDTLIYYVD